MGKKGLNNLDLQISYDELADVLYISFGDPRPGIATEVNDGDFVRVDPYTKKVLGITLLYFKERYMQKTSLSIKESAQNIIPKVLKEFRG